MSVLELSQRTLLQIQLILQQRNELSDYILLKDLVDVGTIDRSSLLQPTKNVIFHFLYTVRIQIADMAGF